MVSGGRNRKTLVTAGSEPVLSASGGGAVAGSAQGRGGVALFGRVLNTGEMVWWEGNIITAIGWLGVDAGRPRSRVYPKKACRILLNQVQPLPENHGGERIRPGASDADKISPGRKGHSVSS